MENDLKSYESMTDARRSLGQYFAFYDDERRHQSLDRRTPDSVYYNEAARQATGNRDGALSVLANY